MYFFFNFEFFKILNFEIFRNIRAIHDLSVICYSFLWSLLPDKFTRDTRNYQLLVICHARSNVTSLNFSLKKRSKHNNKITQLCWNCEITDTKIISIKKKGQSTTKKSQSCVKIVKLPIKKVLVFFSLDKDYQVHIRSALRAHLIWTW